MLQSTPLQRNGPKSDNDMNIWCVKTCQDRDDHGFVELIYKFTQKVVVYCGINL